ncbi:MAG: autotransporter-associated beta strand repeat-containing protein [Pirellulales bacterium]|nr:autotransporter-associated beta strand repeat-containing protein [Pirellulales bacterium]
MNPILMAAGVVGAAFVAQAETYSISGGDSVWDTPANWVEGTVPNAVGAAAIFDSPMATRTVNLDGTDITIGSLTFNNDSTFSNTIRSNSGNGGTNTLTFDAADAGPATITSTGTGTNANTLSQRTIIFADSVVANITNVAGNAAGALSLTGNVTGPGGLTKEGLGTMTMGFIVGSNGQVKNYEGPTIVNAGRLRLSQGGAPGMTSSVTVNSGGQVLLITGVAGSNTGIYTFGASASTVVTLNGTGPTNLTTASSGPGALRLETANASPTQVTNLITLASNSSVNVNGAANVLQLNNTISGPGGLTMGTLGNAGDTGTLLLNGANSYSGGTTVNLGTLALDGLNATLGGGNVTVEGLTAGAAGLLEIRGGVADAIANAATLTLTGGAGGGKINLPDGVTNETVGGLVLGGAAQPAGVYTNATHPNFITGSGSITVAAAPIADADFDNDGDVDGADFLTWQQGLGLTGAAATNAAGNADGDMDVDGDDLAVWRTEFGPAAVAGVGAVPEPATALLFALVVSALMLSIRKS